MNILLIGAGAVGEAYTQLIAQADPKGEWSPKMIISDYSGQRAKEVADRLGDPKRFPSMAINAGDREAVAAVVKEHKIDLIMNGCPQHFDEPIFDAAFAAGCNYMDMAYTLSKPDEKDPWNKPGVKLGDYQFARAQQWADKGLLAFLGAGADPGTSQVFAAYAAKHLFDEIDEIGIRDGANFQLEGVRYAVQFSVWSVIEECTNPPVFWSRDRGYYTSKPFAEPEIFDFPGGIGPIEIIAIEHEEVLAIPRVIDKGLKHVNFKISLGDDMIQALKMLHEMGLTNAEKIKVGDVEVAPRDVVAACWPDPAKVGPLMTGRICVGTLVKGRKDGKARESYIYNIADNAECMRRLGCQAVAAQTAMGPAVTTELLATGKWKGAGVLTPESFDPDPYLELMPKYGFTWDCRDSF